MAALQQFLRLVRAPNLLFIIITQTLFQYAIYYPVYKNEIPPDDNFRFVMLLLASVCIAAAGYIINDYFDTNIDRINKPDKVVISKAISRRSAQLWHIGLNIMGIAFTCYGVRRGYNGYLVAINILTIILLWLYSAQLKKRLLVGNVVVALLTGWTIVVIFLSKHSIAQALGGSAAQLKFFRFAILYAGFAFIISLIREAVKDMEDMPGDRKYGCTTMPIVWGITAVKVYMAVWLTILIIMVAVAQVYILQLGWWPEVLYALLLIIAPLIFLFKKMITATTTAQFHTCSSYCKWIMLSGILSMLFFYFYL